MHVRRLTWAGLEIRAGQSTLVVDLLENSPSLSKYAGTPSEPLLPPAAGPGTVTAAAITHEHSDHLDAPALRHRLAPDAPVLCPPGAVDVVTEAGLAARGVEPWETVAVDELQLTAVPAVDGFGTPQTSWVIAHGDRQLIHCGDTLWHGFWWQIAKRTGPIDLAFLPINGAIVIFDYLEPSTSGLPAVLTPEQAAAAAELLGARQAAPIHYGTFHKPPLYVSLPDPEPAFVAAAARRGVATNVLRPGQEIEL